MIQQKNIFLGCVLLLFLAGCSTPPKKTTTPPPTPAKKPPEQTAEAPPQSIGNDAQTRINNWHQLIDQHRNDSSHNKLKQTNQFINQLTFVDDLTHWGKEDYWATPIETLSSGGGDSEDFIIAKYITLKKMSIPDACMRLVYVKAQTINKAHMVLTHQCTPTDSVLVLDNLNPKILKAEQRPDLTPIYSFNAADLWVNKQLDNAKQTGPAEQIGLWQQLMEKIQQEEAHFGK